MGINKEETSEQTWSAIVHVNLALKSYALLSGTNAHTEIHTETDAALTDGDDDDMAFGRSRTQMVDT